jgi:tryptophanyl-tRNA synthetase
MRIFSGIQPTGRKHLGNYLGAIRNYVALQDAGESIYCVVDLHAITVAFDPIDLRERVYDTASILLAAGLDPSRCILFRQSDIHEHTELCWMLTSVTAYGELSRMTQFKEKSEEQKAFVSAGLLLYPVLQAADILAYQTDQVPVGEDQKQHLELSRNIAERFNSRFGETFVVPEHRIPEVAARVKDLQAPDKRMSTTAGTEHGTLFVLDEPDMIRRKFKSAVTDTGREVVRAPHKLGISNLIEIMAAARGMTTDAIEEEYADAHGYADFKRDVGDAVIQLLTPIQQRYAEIRPAKAALEGILLEGAERARTIASHTLALVRSRMALGPPP